MRHRACQKFNSFCRQPKHITLMYSKQKNKDRKILRYWLSNRTLSSGQKRRPRKKGMASKRKQTKMRPVCLLSSVFGLNVRQYEQPFLATNQATLLHCKLIHVVAHIATPFASSDTSLLEVDRTSTLSNMFLQLKKMHCLRGEFT